MSKKVLIVDDSQAEVHLMQSMLQQGGFHSVGISDSTKIEEAIDDERPNVILLDVVMPRRNGFQACRDLKRSQEFGDIPIVLVTSKNGESDKFWGMQQGADGYVVKPFTGAQLVDEVQRVIG